MEESMSKRGRPPKVGGVVYKRDNSEFWQVRYKDKKGEIIRESAGTSDRDEAERFLRDRLDARDEGRLSTVLTSKQLTFNQWADWFLEKRSKPPFRSSGNHEQNLNALKFLWPAFGELALSEITSEAIEDYLGDRLGSGRRIYTKTRTAVAWKDQAGNGPSGIQNTGPHPECCGEAETSSHQSLCFCGISGIREEVDQKTALHDSDRTRED
jgi:hypothetical protein